MLLVGKDHHLEQAWTGRAAAWAVFCLEWVGVVAVAAASWVAFVPGWPSLVELLAVAAVVVFVTFSSVWPPPWQLLLPFWIFPQLLSWPVPLALQDWVFPG